MQINLKNYLSQCFSKREFILTKRGRDSLQAIIEDNKLNGSEIAIQSFICADMFVPFLIKNNLKPILLDSARNNPNVSLQEIKKKYKKNPNINVVFIVHTLGIINEEIKEIGEWCKRKGVFLIEDCVDCAYLDYCGQPIGTFGDAALFSFFKSLRVPIGGLYIKNNGKINLAPKKYKLDKVDLLRLLKRAPFSDLILKVMKPFKKSLKLQIDGPILIPTSVPKFFDYLTFSSKRLDVQKRKKIFESLRILLEKSCSKNVSLICPSQGFFYSIHMKVKDKKLIARKLKKNGIHCTTKWEDSLDTNDALKQRYKLNQTPNARDFANKLLNITINPNWSKKKVKKISQRLSNLLDF
jgi:dTDP-4-amino-4,6-dideoxygalactose transaminase